MSFNPFDTTRGDQEMEFQATAGMVNEYEREIAALKNERDELRLCLLDAVKLASAQAHGEIAWSRRIEAALKGAK